MESKGNAVECSDFPKQLLHRSAAAGVTKEYPYSASPPFGC